MRIRMPAMLYRPLPSSCHPGCCRSHGSGCWCQQRRSGCSTDGETARPHGRRREHCARRGQLQLRRSRPPGTEHRWCYQHRCHVEATRLTGHNGSFLGSLSDNASDALVVVEGQSLTDLLGDLAAAGPLATISSRSYTNWLDTSRSSMTIVRSLDFRPAAGAMASPGVW